MKLNYSALALAVAGALAFPTLSRAATPDSRRAAQLLQAVREDAIDARNHADRIRGYTTNTVLSWDAHAGQLAQIRSDINDIGSKLSALQAIRGDVSPWERDAIDRTAGLVPLLADNAQDALQYVAHNESRFWTPEYRKYADNLYTLSSDLSRSVGAYEEFAKVHRQDLRLEKQLGMTPGA